MGLVIYLKRSNTFKENHVIALCLVVIFMIIYIMVCESIKSSQHRYAINKAASYFSMNCGRLETVFDVEQNFVNTLASDKLFDEFLKMYMSEDEIAEKGYYDYSAGHYDDDISRRKDKELQEKLNSQLYLSKYTRDIAISRIYDGYTLTQKSKIDIAEYLNRYNMTPDYINHIFYQKNTGYKNCEIIPIQNQEGVVLITYRIIIDSKRSAYVFVCLELQKYVESVGGGADLFVLTKGSDFIIADGKIDERNSHDVTEILNEHKNTTLSEITVSSYNGSSGYGYMIKNLKRFSGYSYACFIFPKNKIYITLIVNGLLLLLVGAVSIFLANLISKYIYMPVVRIKTQLVEDKDKKIGLDGIFREISEIIALNKHLKSVVDENHVVLKDKFIADCARGIIEDGYIQKNIKQYGLDKYNDESVCVIFTCDAENTTSPTEWQQLKDIALFEIKQGIGGSADIIDSDYMEFLLIKRCRDISALKNDISNLLKEMETRYTISIYASMSDIFKGIYNLHTAYSQAKYTKNARVFMNWSYCIAYSEISDRDNGGVKFYSVDDEKRLVDSVLNNNIELSRIILSNILKANILNQEVSGNDVNEFIFLMTSTIKRVTAQLKKSEAEIFGSDFVIYLEFKMCETRQELFDKIMLVFEKIYDVLNSVQKSTGDRISKDILKYIDDNFTKDISLTDVCDEFSLSLSYVSRILKECKNVNFKSYITKKRIEESKRIMSGNKYLKVKDVSKMVGYINTATFIRIFKKEEGISPGQFIKNL